MRFCAFVAALLAACTLAPGAAGEPPHGQPVAELSGEVLTPDDKPIVGARVTIWEAGPREGPSYYCPGCYRDCGRSAVSDASGRFRIDGLDDTLRYIVLVTRDGFVPFRTTNFQNPALGPKVGDKAFRLTPRDWNAYKPSQTLVGHVVNANGEPVAGAAVESWAAMSASGGGMMGAVDGLDPLAVTDEQGRFRMGYNKEVDRISVTVKAPAMARAVFPNLETGKDHELRMVEGGSVRGRLVRAGRPVEGVEIGIYNQRRGVDDQPREERIATQPDGSFIITNLPPGQRSWIYAKMDSAKSFGATEIRSIVVPADGQDLDVGDMELGRGFKVAGTLVLDHPGPIPAGRLFLSSTQAWDDQIVVVAPDGRFSFTGVPAGVYDLTYVGDDRQLGLETSARNASVAGPSAGRLTGRVDADRTDLIVLLTKRDPHPPRHLQAWERPLEGVEP